jgi:hypothetical protein
MAVAGLQQIVLRQSSGSNIAGIVTAAAAAATAIIAGMAAVGAFKGITQNRVQDRQTRAHRYLERFNSPSELVSRTRLHDFYMSGPPDTPGTQGARRRWERRRIAAWERMSHADKLSTVHGLNFWEELAGMYNRGLVDRPIVADYFGTAALSVWEGTQWFISYMRKGQPSAWEQLEEMCRSIREIRSQ